MAIFLAGQGLRIDSHSITGQRPFGLLRAFVHGSGCLSHSEVELRLDTSPFQIWKVSEGFFVKGLSILVFILQPIGKGPMN